ncbi:hypothetical protein EW146_g9140 [Bondarzewia mesenterica]|uniref:Uncharacterized protein n=1 Tax=Bondarzewia mesenterica TaxID=1095465 RepID=A0A4V3XD08_9AGAM|nr:hypothetical protein EW146_g9140 [Bondarzewia mesenterica]
MKMPTSMTVPAIDHLIDSSVPAYSPESWQSFIQPEGKAYSVSRREKFLLISEAPLSHTELFDKTLVWATLFETWVSKIGIAPGNTVELWTDCEAESCKYYFADHSKRTIFWLDAQDSDTLGLPTSSSLQLKYAVEAEYWRHVEQFPMHFGGITVEAFDDLYVIFLHGRADNLTSSSATFPYSADECATLITVLRDSRDLISDGRITCFVARLWGFVASYRHRIHYGEEHSQLSRIKPTFETPEAKRNIVFTLCSRLLFNMPELYRQQFEDLFVDEHVHHHVWKDFVTEKLGEWKTLMQWSFPLLISNILIMPYTFSRTTTLASMFLDTASIVMTITMYQIQHDFVNWGNAPNYLLYQKNKHEYQPIAIIYSLPKSLFIWALLVFFIQILGTLSVLASIPVAVICLTSVGILIVAVWWTLWPGSFSFDMASPWSMRETPVSLV